MGYDFSNGIVAHYASYNWSDYHYKMKIFYVRNIYGKTGKEAAKMIQEALRVLNEKFGATPGMKTQVDSWGVWKEDIPMFVGMNVQPSTRESPWDQGVIKQLDGHQTDHVQIEWENVNGLKKQDELVSWVPVSEIKPGVAYGSLDRHVRFADILQDILNSCLKYPDAMWEGD